MKGKIAFVLLSFIIIIISGCAGQAGREWRGWPYFANPFREFHLRALPTDYDPNFPLNSERIDGRTLCVPLGQTRNVRIIPGYTGKEECFTFEIHAYKNGIGYLINANSIGEFIANSGKQAGGITDIYRFEKTPVARNPFFDYCQNEHPDTASEILKVYFCQDQLCSDRPKGSIFLR